MNQIRLTKGYGLLVKSNLAKCKWHNRLISFVVAIPQLYRVSQRILLYNCRNRFNEAAVAAAVAARFDGAAAAAVAVSTSFLNESDREVKAEPREPGSSATNSGNSQQQTPQSSSSAGTIYIYLDSKLLASFSHVVVHFFISWLVLGRNQMCCSCCSDQTAHKLVLTGSAK